MKRAYVLLVAVMVLVLSTTLLTGCGSFEDQAEDSARDYYEGNDHPGEVQSSKYKSQIKPLADGDQPSSHQMMAMTILQGAGESTDLSSYDRLDLVELTLSDGTSVMAVVVNEGGNVIFPQNVDEAK